MTWHDVTWRDWSWHDMTWHGFYVSEFTCGFFLLQFLGDRKTWMTRYVYYVIFYFSCKSYVYAIASSEDISTYAPKSANFFHTYIEISFERLISTYVKNDQIFTPFLGRFEVNFSLINVAPGECRGVPKPGRYEKVTPAQNDHYATLNWFPTRKGWCTPDLDCCILRHV